MQKFKVMLRGFRFLAYVDPKDVGKSEAPVHAAQLTATSGEVVREARDWLLVDAPGAEQAQAAFLEAHGLSARKLRAGAEFVVEAVAA